MQTALTHESGSADPQSKRLQSLGDCGEERTTCNVGVFGPTDQDAGEAVSKGGCRGTFCIESFSQALLYEAPDSASPLRTSTLCEYESASNDTSRDAESGASYMACIGVVVFSLDCSVVRSCIVTVIVICIPSPIFNLCPCALPVPILRLCILALTCSATIVCADENFNILLSLVRPSRSTVLETLCLVRSLNTVQSLL